MRTAADIALGGDGTGRSWGPGRGATGVSGSPYHFYLNTFDGSGGSLDNQMAAGAVFTPPVTPTVTTLVHNAAHADITGTSVPAGTVVHDNATVDTGSASTTIPAGSTFTFHRYATIDCTGTDTPQTGVAVPSGAQTGVAESSTFTPGVGSFSYKADFVSGGASVTNATGICEPFTVISVTPTVTTHVHNAAHQDITSTAVALGSIVHDSVTVTGASGTPTGNVTFDFFNNGTCANTPAATSGNVALSGGSADATGFAQGPLAAGSYSFLAHYAGAAPYVAGDGTCEPFTVNKAQLAVTTNVHNAAHADITNSSVALGSIVHDTATVTGGVTGFTVPTPTFTLTSAYTGTCAAGSAVANNGTEGSAAKSADSAALGAGAYAYRGAVAGDSNYLGANSICEPFTVNKAQLNISTDIHNAAHASVTSVPVGSVVHDTASVTGQVGGFTPTGAVTFTFGATCPGSAIANSGSADSSTGGPRSVDTSALTPGSYNFQATVAADANYLGNTSSCEPLTVNKGTSSVNTELHKTADESVVTVGSSVPLGTVMHDKATVGVSDGFAATGNVTFSFFTNGTCANTPVSTSDVALSAGVAHPSQSSGTLSAGSYSFQATWPGDTNYTGSTSACEHFTVDKADTTTATAIHLGSDHTTDIQNTSIALNSSIHDKGDVSGQVGSITPTGTLTYKYYTTNNCTGSSADETLALGSESSTHSNLAAGDYSFLTSYSGDSNYNGSTAACEKVHVNKVQLAIGTTVHNEAGDVPLVGNLPLGGGAHDSGAVTGAVGSFTLPNVTFYFFPKGVTCTNGSTTGATALNAVSPDGAGVAHPSTSETGLAAGSYNFMAVVAGNANYLGATSDCEPFTVNKAQLAVSTTIHDTNHGAVVAAIPLGSVVHDTAGITGQVGSFTPTGAVTFYFGPGFAETCKDPNIYPVIATSGSPDAGNGNPRSVDTTSLGAGNYQFWAHVAGDDNYLGASSDCEPFSVNKANSSTVTEIHNAAEGVVTSVALGTTVHDKATVSGTSFGTPTGTVDFSFYSNNTCEGPGLAAGTGIALVAGVAHPSSSEGPLGAGSYSFQAVYSGDSNYNSSTGACEPLTVNKAPLSVTTAIHNANHDVVTAVATGAVVHDTAAVSGQVGSFVPAGAVTFTFGATCPGSAIATDGSLDSGMPRSVDTSALTTGTYAFQATVAGDDNYTGATSDCEPLSAVDARISIGTSGTNKINDAHTFTVTVEKNDGTAWAPAAGLTVTPSETGVGSLTGTGTCETAVTNASGQCTIIVSSSAAGQSTVDASATVSVSGVNIAVATNGYGANTISNVKTWVDGQITISADSTNELNQAHTFTVTVKKDLGDGSGLVVAVGETVSSSITGTGGITGGTCTTTTTDVSGQCTIIVNSATPGTGTVHASVTMLLGSPTASVTRATGDNLSGDSADAHKTWINPHTTIHITSNTQETAPGENVILTISDTNDGNVPLTNNTVTLTYGLTTVVLDQFSAGFSGDTGNDGIMSPGETWTWTVNVIISSDITFTVNGDGIDPLNNHVSPATGFTSETSNITVHVIGTTRTLGFWQTHTSFTDAVFNLAGMQKYVGVNIPVAAGTHKGQITDTQSVGASQLLGGFYAPIAKDTTGAKRTPADQARITLLQQLLAAKLNCAAFGCSLTVQGQIATADADYAAGTKNAIMADVGILDAYNNSQDSGAIPSTLPPTGKATPKTSTSYAYTAFWNQP